MRLLFRGRYVGFPMVTRDAVIAERARTARDSNQLAASASERHFGTDRKAIWHSDIGSRRRSLIARVALALFEHCNFIWRV